MSLVERKGSLLWCWEYLFIITHREKSMSLLVKPMVVVKRIGSIPIFLLKISILNVEYKKGIICIHILKFGFSWHVIKYSKFESTAYVSKHLNLVLIDN